MPKFSNPVSYTGAKATSKRRGQLRIASQTEVNAAVADDIAVCPKTLDAAVDALIASASTTVAGKIRIATDLEAVAGVSTTTAMTPHTVGLVAIAGAPLASEILAGIAELATQAETNAGTDDNRIVTPLKLTTLLTTPPAIGGTTPAAGAFTNLSAKGLILAVTPVATAASPYAVLGTDYFITTDSTGGALTINLPAVPEVGRTYVIYDATGQANIGGNITVTGVAGNITAGGASAATFVLNTAYESLMVTWNGTTWCGRNVV